MVARSCRKHPLFGLVQNPPGSPSTCSAANPLVPLRANASVSASRAAVALAIVTAGNSESMSEARAVLVRYVALDVLDDDSLRPHVAGFRARIVLHHPARCVLELGQREQVECGVKLVGAECL